MKSFNIKYCIGDYNPKRIKVKSIKNVRDEREAFRRFHEQVQNAFITAIEEYYYEKGKTNFKDPAGHAQGGV